MIWKIMSLLAQQIFHQNKQQNHLNISNLNICIYIKKKLHSSPDLLNLYSSTLPTLEPI